MNYRKKISRHLSNLRGWRTNRKFVIFESDDWGSTRMPSLEVYEQLEQAGLDLSSGDSKRYNTADTLASKEDLSQLFDVLLAFKDSQSKPAVFTALSLVANPDFDSIKANDFEEYVYETLPQTLERYERSDAWPYWETGGEQGVFVPEFHGREHLNVTAWMRALRSGNEEAKLAFQYQFWGYKNQTEIQPVKFQAAFGLEKQEDVDVQKNILEDGLQLFAKLHPDPARLFVPPNGDLNNELQSVAMAGGVKYLTTAKVHRNTLANKKGKKEFRSLGQRNEIGLTYITRNCFFEPSRFGEKAVSSCLEDIAIAFTWNKPAVISTHRVNYIGSNIVENRTTGLKALTKLLQQITKRWPEVEFISTKELGDIITRK